ncbi:MAG: tyrosine-type recombinase/integrase [Hyphomicrobiaceae bacterium]
MVGQPLTDIAIRKLVVGTRERVEIWDSKIPGFGVRASGKGTKSFILVYRHRGRPRRLTLGRYPTLSLSDARRKALDALKTVSDGGDPSAIKETGRNSRRFDDAISAFVAQHCQRHNRAVTAKETERVLRQQFVRRWASRDIRDITKQDIVDVIEGVMANGAPSAANHALAAIRKFFNWSVERGLVEESPCAGIRKPARVIARERVLSEEELARVWDAAEAVGYPFGRMVQLLILLAQRRNEVASMRWCDIDRRDNLWTLPSEATKSNRSHSVPLAPQALTIIDGCAKLHDAFVFPSGGADGRTFSGFSKAKRRLDAAAGVADWTLHDLRRTAATHMARLGVAPHVVERILNHTSGSLGGVAGIYNRFSYLPEMREALEAWAKHVESIVAVDPVHT